MIEVDHYQFIRIPTQVKIFLKEILSDALVFLAIQ